MTVSKYVLKNTNQEAVVKVAGTAATETITLGTDLVAATQTVAEGQSPNVVITGLQWSGATGGEIQISRNDVIIATLQTTAAGALEMNGQMMIPDSVESLSDIDVTISGAQSEVWIRLKKVGGYATKVETAQFGSYDNPSQVGS